MKKQKKKKLKRKIWFSIGLLLIASFAIFFYYNTSSERKNDSEFSKPYEPTFTKNGQLVFIKKEINDTIKVIDIEIADDKAKITQGLMWRRSMPDSVGMLFIFEEEKFLSFWMKDTYIPLDIIFINKSMEIVSIRENTIPLSEMSIPSEKAAQYVVEVNAGFCYNYKIDIGDKIKFEIIK